MPRDWLSDIFYEPDLDKEFDKRGITVPENVQNMQDLGKRRDKKRQLIRNYDRINRRKQQRNNIRWIVGAIALVLIAVLVAGILTHWGFGFPAKAEAQPASESVALLPTSLPQPTPTLYPIQPTYTPYPAQPTYTPLATSVLSNSTLADSAPVTVTNTVTLGDPVSTWKQGGWAVSEFDLANDPIVKTWIQKLQDPAPAKWQVFPNVPNPLVPDFKVSNGMEYGMADSPFCDQDQRCDFVVPAWHYRLITGDYKFLNFECRNTDQTRQGCMLLLINVMDATFTWRNQSVDNGFTLMGRYWNGDELQWGVWGLVSHTSANMLGMKTFRNPNTGDILNAGDLPGDAGSNCGTPNACPVVNVRVVVHAGDRILAVLETNVKP